MIQNDKDIEPTANIESPEQTQARTGVTTDRQLLGFNIPLWFGLAVITLSLGLILGGYTGTGIKMLFWSCLTAALIASFLIFKNLADISQWILRTDREATTWTWYNRKKILFVAASCLAISIALKARSPEILGFEALITILGICFLLLYSGLLNPALMMRERQNDGLFFPIADARKYVDEEESVIVIDANGHARAHPDRQVLRPHVAGNRTIGGENIVLTYCGLTNLGTAVIPEIDGQALNLRPLTQLKNNLMLVDENSGEPIQQLWLQKESDVGKSTDHRMKEWPTFRMPFSKFARAYPEGEVFINDYSTDDLKPGFFRNPFLAIYDSLIEKVFAHAIRRQANEEAPVFPSIEYSDKRLASKEKIWAFNVGDDYVAYTEEFVRDNDNLINTVVGGMDIVVSYDRAYESLGVYYNSSGAPIKEIDFFGNTPAGRMPRVETLKAGAYWIVWSNHFKEADTNRI